MALVLTDLKMEPMDGGTLLREVRNRGIDTPFIIMSGHSPERISVLAGADSRTRTLPKPWTSGQLAAAVNAALAASAGSFERDTAATPRTMGG